MSGLRNPGPERRYEDVRIVVNDYAGHAFPLDLSAELANRGFEVHHAYCSTNVAPHGALHSASGFSVHGISVGREFSKYSLRRRLVDEIRYGIGSSRLVRRVRPNHVLASQVPLVSLLIMWVAARTTGAVLVLWLQDIQAGLARHTLGRTRKSRFVGDALRRLERFIIRKADHIIAISADFVPEILQSGKDPEAVDVIENWAPVAELPQQPKWNSWAKQHGFDDRFVFLYSGTLARKHSPELLLELADAFAEDDPEVMVVVVTEGVGGDWLKERPRKNLEILPYQPFERLPEVLGAADVLVTLLDPGAGKFSVPSKTLSYLCAGRPILGSIPADNAAADLVRERAKAGIIVPPADPRALIQAARQLRSDEALRSRLGASGRTYAEDHFDRWLIGNRFCDALRISGRADADPLRGSRSSQESLEAQL